MSRGRRAGSSRLTEELLPTAAARRGARPAPGDRAVHRLPPQEAGYARHDHEEEHNGDNGDFISGGAALVLTTASARRFGVRPDKAGELSTGGGHAENVRRASAPRVGVADSGVALVRILENGEDGLGREWQIAHIACGETK